MDVVSVQRIDDSWQPKAACRGPQATIFYPPSAVERKEDKDLREARAKSICATCSVKQPCLEYALDIKEQHGVWGGLNELERKALLTRRGRF